MATTREDKFGTIIPDFSAYEINELKKLVRKESGNKESSGYYAKCLKFILEIDSDKHKFKLTPKQIGWLKGIKSEIGEQD